MLPSAIVIVLRETLEASILISVMLSIGRHYRLGISWLFIALTVGLVGATFYALNLGTISDMFDYVGQEVVNALLQYTIYFILLVICVAQYHGSSKSLRHLVVFMGAAVAIAVVREGGELVIFYSGILQDEANLLNAATSGFIGLAVGMSAGALCFYALAALPSLQVRKIHIILICFIAGGMVLQATQLLIQADWIPAYTAIWDSNWLLSEASITGQLAYAVFGYEATPSLLELSVYLNALLIMPALVLLSKRWLVDPSLNIEK